MTTYVLCEETGDYDYKQTTPIATAPTLEGIAAKLFARLTPTEANGVITIRLSGTYTVTKLEDE